MAIHIHVHQTGRDCDGRTEHEHIMAPYGKPITDVTALIGSYVSHDPDFPSTVSCERVNMSRTQVLEWTIHHETEEGYSRTVLTTCEELHDERDYPTQRDYTAEREGY